VRKFDVIAVTRIEVGDGVRTDGCAQVEKVRRAAA